MYMYKEYTLTWKEKEKKELSALHEKKKKTL